MSQWVDTVLVVVVLTNLMLLSSSRLGMMIRVVAIQGLVLGLLPLFSHDRSLAWVLPMALVSAAVKGIVFPRLLTRALREASIRREVEPFVGYTPSILFGASILAVSFWLGWRLPLPREALSTLVVPVSLSTILIGLFLVISRKKALTQVVGYLVFENGIYTFGMGLALETPLLVELGILLDVFVAVFVMGIAMFHISREFDDLDSHYLSALKD